MASPRSPSPEDDRRSPISPHSDGELASKRKRSASRSRSPASPPPPPAARRRHSPALAEQAPAARPSVIDSNHARRQERERQAALRLVEAEIAGPKDQVDPKALVARDALTRTGGAYIPPARLRAMQAAASTDKVSRLQLTSVTEADLARPAVLCRVPASHLGRLAQVHQWSHQQGQRRQHQTHRSRALWGESHSRQRSILSFYDEGSGHFIAIHTCDGSCCFNREHQAASGRRAAPHEAHQPIPPSIQAK